MKRLIERLFGRADVNQVLASFTKLVAKLDAIEERVREEEVETQRTIAELSVRVLNLAEERKRAVSVANKLSALVA